ncbi:transporter, major facilitator family protein [delta proteobacterium NaphS2]|nr:transporter, major facilitator family protein [delta proteobacterium NaphS2]
MQWRIWALATAGKFFEGLVVFMTGVALPLMVAEFSLSALQKGVLSASPLFGILVGATALGGLSDHFGRKRMFITEMAIFSICLSLLVLSPGYICLLLFLFGMGLALGCDYPTAHMVISESIPSKDRGKLVLSAFGFQAIGALVGTAVGYLVLHKNPEVAAWRWMYATAVIPALLVLAGRFFIPDSGHWLVCRGKVREAEREVARLLRRKPPYPKKINLNCTHPVDFSGNPVTRKRHYGVLFSKRFRRVTILASVPWFLQDLSTYGIGIFTPTILASVIGPETRYAHNLADIIHNDIIAAKGAGLSASFAKVGAVLTAFLFPVLLADLGTKVLLYALVGASLLGAVVTLRFRVETKGINLEELGGITENSADARQTTSL